MAVINNHIILIGFKHTGKSTVGKVLASTLQIPFIDLDREVERYHEIHTREKHTCREIVHSKGEVFFRKLEKKILSDVTGLSPSVISLGGGTSLSETNLENIRGCAIVHIEADKHVTFSRILKEGHPAFIDKEDDILKSLNQLWQQRTTAYAERCDFSVNNTGHISDTVKEIITKLKG